MANLAAEDEGIPLLIANLLLELRFAEPEVEEINPLLEHIKGIDPDSLTPRRALEILYELRDRLK